MRSEVFENYINIMTEKGFVKKEAETRVDKENSSEYRDTIKALYGLDIKLNDSNKTFVEQAHPDKVIIAPSYDRVNGLVENIQERHDIMVGIVTKAPNGNLTQRRYAQKELLDELIRLGFSLDNSGEEELSKLADECSVKLSAEMQSVKTIKKEAFGWMAALPFVMKAVPWILGIAGVLAVKQHVIGTFSQGVIPDIDQAITELQNLEAAVGASDRAVLGKLIKILVLFKRKTAAIMPILSNSENQQIESLDSPQDISGVRYKVKGTLEEIREVNKYLKICSALASHLNSVEDQIRAMEPQRVSHENEFLFTLKQVWEGMAGSDSSDAANATDALEDSLVSFVNKYSTATTEEAGKAREKAQGIMGELSGLLDDGDGNGDPGQSAMDIPAVLQGLFR